MPEYAQKGENRIGAAEKPIIREKASLSINNEDDFGNAQAIVAEFLERNLPEGAVMLEVAVNEAMNNAFRASESFYVRLSRYGGRIIIRVKDEGQGFAGAAALNSFRDEDDINRELDNIGLRESGRGVLIMKMFCDLLLYNVKGNEVLLTKKL